MSTSTLVAVALVTVMVKLTVPPGATLAGDAAAPSVKPLVGAGVGVAVAVTVGAGVVGTGVRVGVGVAVGPAVALGPGVGVGVGEGVATGAFTENVAAELRGLYTVAQAGAYTASLTVYTPRAELAGTCHVAG